MTLIYFLKNYYCGVYNNYNFTLHLQRNEIFVNGLLSTCNHDIDNNKPLCIEVRNAHISNWHVNKMFICVLSVYVTYIKLHYKGVL